MEFENIQDELSNEGQNLIITPQMKNTLFSLSKWVHFIALTSLILCGLAILLLIFGSGLFLSALSSTGVFEGGSSLGIITIFFYCIMFAIGFYIMYLLYDFSKKMKVGLRENNETLVHQAFISLKTHYTIYGIFFIIYLFFVGIGLIMMLVGGMML